MIITLPPTALPSVGLFSGHETFSFQHLWLKKGLDGWQRGPDLLAAD